MKEANANWSRRRVLVAGAVGLVSTNPLLSACKRKDAALDKLWQQWQADWRWMEGITRQRGWEVTVLNIAPPALLARLAGIERRHGLKFPPQLRAVLTQLSAHIQFGWYIPSHLQPMERQEMPTSSGIRDAVWDLGAIDEQAIPNFVGWKRELARKDVSEAANRPEMWENQFPFGYLKNGDILTIDMSKPEPALQPVRYFSHNLEMIHGCALAPDFYSFISVFSKLGCAGTECWSWMRFGEGIKDDTFALSVDTEGAKAWLAWLSKDPSKPEPDEPPVAIVETTSADRALLGVARLGSLPGLTAALQAGAKIDCVPSQDWQQQTGKWTEELSTAVAYATLNDDIAMLDMLVKRGGCRSAMRLRRVLAQLSNG